MKSRYDRLIRYLPAELKAEAGAAYCEGIQELRLRSGRAMTAVIDGKERTLGVAVTPQHISALAMAAARGSVYAVQDSLKNGYITVDGGNRIGFCGTAVMKNGQVDNLRSLSSAALRLAREIKTAAEPVEKLGKFTSTLIIAPPGAGKTTMLRDLIRRMSGQGRRVAVADERGEIAAVENGLPGFDLGVSTDILTGCPKSQGMLMLLRTMNPEVIAADEITAPEDASAVELCRNCGVDILATVHGIGLKDVAEKPMIKRLLDANAFQLIVTISGPDRQVKVERTDA